MRHFIYKEMPNLNVIRLSYSAPDINSDLAFNPINASESRSALESGYPNYSLVQTTYLSERAIARKPAE
ncbi:hypothetical protein LX81_00853 [Palleronia aestuarii]|uniref:Uncharacterized protein n=1 Tax=Palleronia aestuarii TaxID=568105 RepID=A0A2W7NNR3_9RHOB|nr:hypothetical protein LX81_00853 [Palleronia aestuarii]